MPNEPHVIEPALALHEWYDVKESDRGFLHVAAGAMMQAFMPNADDPGLGRTTSERLAACMALANVGLSRSDPRKITHEDVVLLLEYAAAQHHFGLTMLAMKLESLLPPDVTTYTLAPPQT